MKSDALIILPLFLLVVTGFIYTNYQASQSSCLGNIGCTTTPSGNVDTDSALFNLMTGDYAGLFSSLVAVTFGSESPYKIWIPFIGFTWSYTVALPSFYVPTLIFSWATIGGGIVNVPNFLGGSFPITLPLITVPALALGQYYVQPGIITLPWLYETSYQVTLPVPTFAALSLLVGGIMLFLGLGISISLLGSGFEINPQGSRTLTVIGTGIVLWTFISLFTGDWILSLPYSWGPILMGFLELMFIIGIYNRIPGGE